MKNVHKTRSRGALLLAVCFLFTVPVLSAALAGTAAEQTGRSVFYGQVTAINGTNVTIAIGTVTMPEIPAQDSSNGQGGSENGAPQGGAMGSLLEGFTPTGESVTVQITDAVTLTRQGGPGMDGQHPDASSGATAQAGGQQNGNQPGGRTQGTLPANGERGQGGMGVGGWGETAALSDLAVGSYVLLTYQTSTQALLSVYILSTGETQTA